jgi:hypothetical protein
MTKLSFAVAAVSFVASFACAFAQAEKIKGKAKDLKKQVESGQTNKAPATTNAPAKSR